MAIATGGASMGHAEHVRYVAYLAMIVGGIQAGAGFVALGGVATLTGSLGSVESIVLVLLLGFGLVGVLAGTGLLRGRPWSRPLMFLYAALSLLSIPLGTAFGLYAMWALTRRGAGNETST